MKIKIENILTVVYLVMTAIGYYYETMTTGEWLIALILIGIYHILLGKTENS